MASQMEQRQKVDALKFKEAGLGPIQKTYAANPKAILAEKKWRSFDIICFRSCWQTERRKKDWQGKKIKKKDSIKCGHFKGRMKEKDEKIEFGCVKIGMFVFQSRQSKNRIELR